jgi:hypothetical protein
MEAEQRPNEPPHAHTQDDELASLKLATTHAFDAITEMQDRFVSLETSIAESLNRSHPTTSLILNTILPGEAIQNYVPWVDSTTLTSVVAHTLDISHFIKLIPIEERPKGQTRAGLPSSLIFDMETGKSSVFTEGNVMYDKAFTDFPTLVKALTVFQTIRHLYDIDNIGYGRAIALYIRQLATWEKQYNWPAIMAYFTAHFRKYQAATDPRLWFQVDIQLFVTFMSRDAISSSPVPSTFNKSLASSYASSTTCKNWNSDGGCNWQGCPRKHICLRCSGEHTVSHCATKST